MNLLEQAKVFAATTGYNLNIKTTTEVDNINDLMKNVVNIVSILAGVLAFIYLIYSGILYLTAGGNPDAAKKGQQGILNAIIGIVIIIAAYSILRAVSGTASSTIGTK